MYDNTDVFVGHLGAFSQEGELGQSRHYIHKDPSKRDCSFR